MTVGELARTDVVTVEPAASVAAIVEAMRANGVGSVVVESDGDAVGIITDRDLALGALGDGADPASLTARDLMTEDPFTVEAGTGVFETVREMAGAEVRRVPVVDGGELVGIVTLDDLVVLLTRELADLGGIIEAESPAYPYERPDG